jgi:predicted DNA binding protein
MRYLTVLVHPAAGGTLHPLAQKLRDEPSITREAIHHVELLVDGTVLLLGEGSGDAERYEEIMADEPSVLDHMVSGDKQWMAVSQFEPSDVIRQILERRRESDIVVETPIRINADGSLRITYLGSESALRELFRGADDESELRVDVVETGEYDPDRSSFTRLLTTRQQDVLEAAVSVGYYSVPREATHEDVAEAVGIAPSTAGEHLRKIEMQVFDALVR